MAQEKSALPKIWCLFSVDQNYDQPEYNLVAWWSQKPNLEQLFKTLGVKMDGRDEDIVFVVNVFTGKDEKRHIDGTSYRLREVEEGVLPEGKY
jgi:hypothetical protein